MLFIFKIIVSAVMIASISELAKRNTFVAALTASLPLTSLIAILFLYFETRDVQKIANLCTGIFLAVIPSLLFFAALPLLLRKGMSFTPALGLTIAATAAFYPIFFKALKLFGVEM